MRGISSRHGSHQVAMKLTQTGLPLSAESAISPPPRAGTVSGGAGSPTPNASPGETDAAGDATPDGEAADDADGSGDAVGAGGSVAAATGDGTRRGGRRA